MFNIAASTFKNKLLTLKNFLWLFSMLVCIQFLDELLDSIGFQLENNIGDFLFDGMQLLIIGFGVYFFLNRIEKYVQKIRLNDLFLHTVIENMDEGIAVCDKEGNLVFESGTASIRKTSAESLSLPISYRKWSLYWDVYESVEGTKVYFENLPLIRALRGEDVKNQELILKQTGKPMQFLSVNGKQIKSKSGEVLGAIVVIRDITEKKEKEEKIRYMAYHDHLTGLPNLRFFKDKVAFFLAEEKQNNHPDLLSIMFLDLDGFKSINDHFGHDIGDLLLIEVSQRVTACLREGEIAARIGGDEFTLLIPTLKTEDDAIIIAKNIIKAVGSPYYIQGNKLQVTVSIGITFSPKDGIDRRTLLKNADNAMYAAKNSGKNQFCVFHDKPAPLNEKVTIK